MTYLEIYSGMGRFSLFLLSLTPSPVLHCYFVFSRLLISPFHPFHPSFPSLLPNHPRHFTSYSFSAGKIQVLRYSVSRKTAFITFFSPAISYNTKLDILIIGKPPCKLPRSAPAA